MSDRDDPPVRPGDLILALALLSRLPVGSPAATGLHAGPSRAAAASWAYPAAGAVLGALAALAGGLAAWLGLPPSLQAIAVLAALVILTGAMHEDGLADAADGLWGGWDRARRLEIMKDSRIGTYGVLALALSLSARWAALTALIAAGWLAAPVIAAAALSRAPMTGLLAGLDPARDGGLAASVGRPPSEAVWIAATGAVLLALLLTGWAALTAGLAVAAVAVAAARLAVAKIGGHTGDILGATQQLSEIAALAAFAAALG